MDPLGSLLLYSCAPGRVVDAAIGGSSRNGPLATHLMQHLHLGEVQQAVQRVVQAVYKSTDGRQKPWRHSDMMDNFYLGEREANVSVLIDELRICTEQRDVQSIVGVMKQHPSLALLQQKACETLGSLVASGSTGRMIVKVGGIESIVATMQQHSSDVELQR